jgi:surface antigen
MSFSVRATLRATIAAVALLSVPAAWSANQWFIEDTPLGTMTQEDRTLYKRTLDEALNSGTVGETREWKNPGTGNLGSVKVIKDFTRDGSACRRVETFAQTKEVKNRARWNFCKQASGEWKIVTGGTTSK